MLYGYARVSSDGQERYGNGLDAQVEQLIGYGVLPENIYKESFTGTKMHRPMLDKVLGLLKEGDTLVVSKLDRIARTTAGGIELLEELYNKGVDVNILNMGKLDHTPIGKMMRNILLSFAEFERDMIVQRTQEGKAQARANKVGYREGRPKAVVDEAEFQKFREKQKRGEMTASEVAEKLGISRSSYYKLCREVA